LILKLFAFHFFICHSRSVGKFFYLSVGAGAEAEASLTSAAGAASSGTTGTSFLGNFTVLFLSWMCPWTLKDYAPYRKPERLSPAKISLFLLDNGIFLVGIIGTQNLHVPSSRSCLAVLEQNLELGFIFFPYSGKSDS